MGHTRQFVRAALRSVHGELCGGDKDQIKIDTIYEEHLNPCICSLALIINC